MMKNKLNATTRIINALGRNGPMTSGELNELLGITSSSTRIYEINKMYRNFKIMKNKANQHYLKLSYNIHVDHKKVYPNLYR